MVVDNEAHISEKENSSSADYVSTEKSSQISESTIEHIETIDENENVLNSAKNSKGKEKSKDDDEDLFKNEKWLSPELPTCVIYGQYVGPTSQKKLYQNDNKEVTVPAKENQQQPVKNGNSQAAEDKNKPLPVKNTNGDKRNEFPKGNKSEHFPPVSKKNEPQNTNDNKNLPNQLPTFNPIISEKSFTAESIDINIWMKNRLHDMYTTEFLTGIDPEYKLCFGIDTKKDLSDIIISIENTGLKGFWPFNNLLKVDNIQFELLFKSVYEVATSCFAVLCAENGFMFSKNKSTRSFNNLSILGLDVRQELDFLQRVINEICTAVPSAVEATEELRVLFYVLLPAFDARNEMQLREHGVTYAVRTLADKRRYGFDVSEEDIDNMLKYCHESNFSEFVAIVSEDIDMFSTMKHLELVLSHLAKISTYVDIRVKHAAKKVIMNILKKLDIASLNELYLNENIGIPLSFLIGLEQSLPGKAYLSVALFRNVIMEENRRTSLTVSEMRLALMVLYLICPMTDVNEIVYKVFANEEERENVSRADRNTMVQAFQKLPQVLFYRLRGEPLEIDSDRVEKIGEFSIAIEKQMRNGINPKTFRFDIINVVRYLTMSKTLLFGNVLLFLINEVLIAGTCRQRAAEALMQLLNEKSFHQNHYFKKVSIKELVIFALYLYEVPNGPAITFKYRLIESLFKSCVEISQKIKVQICYADFSEKWECMGHPWYARLLLAHKFLSKITNVNTEMEWHIDISDDVDEETRNVRLIKEYSKLALIHTAWPNCTDRQIIVDVLRGQFVPESVDRCALISAMREYAKSPKMNICDSWRDAIDKVYACEQFLMEVKSTIVAEGRATIEGDHPSHDQSQSSANSTDEQDGVTKPKESVKNDEMEEESVISADSTQEDEESESADDSDQVVSEDRMMSMNEAEEWNAIITSVPNDPLPLTSDGEKD